MLKHKEIPDFLRLISQFIKSDNPKTFKSWEVNQPYTDLRIKQMVLKDVRQYCLYSDIAEGYCLDLSLSGKPISSVFLGGNGTGKSTLFASLEYMYLGYSEIALAHSPDKDIEDYFRGINKEAKDIKLECDLMDNISCEGNTITDYGIPSSFCSECDYFQISREWSNITGYIAKQIGFQEVWTQLEDLRKLSRFLNFASKYKEKEQQIAVAKIKLKKFEKGSKEYKAITSRKKTAEKDRRVINDRFLISGGQVYYKRITQFIKEIEKCEDLEQNTDELTNLLDYIEKQWQIIIDLLVRILNSVMPAVLGASLFEGKESIEIKGNKGIVSIELKVKPRNFDVVEDYDERSPIQYLNTFRLKLFCISLKLSLLICSKILHHTVIPFFIDDIFDSSDFNHRSSIGRFIVRLLKAHDSVIASYPEVSKEDLPLQLVFFTQDNIIAENVYNGIRYWSDENQIKNEFGVKFRRLFTPADVITDMDKDDNHHSDLKSITIRGINKMVIDISDPI
ncbi:MAG: hypothetical protein K2L17_11000 [Muribaculaceae bacterium]|nr:hypothetical protein [Muribaculaceae bacterium]